MPVRTEQIHRRGCDDDDYEAYDKVYDKGYDEVLETNLCHYALSNSRT